MKYDPKPFSECGWYSHGCTMLGIALGGALTRFTGIPQWWEILTMLGLWILCMFASGWVKHFGDDDGN